MFELSKREPASHLRKDAARTALKASTALGLTLSAAALLAPIPAHADGGPIVATAQGRVQGLDVNGVSEFLGIPFAAPPVGNLRWRPPVAHATWAGVRQATAYAPICAQIETLGVFAGPANNNEDCLYLNVFTPNVGSHREN
jgi:para-nitrobenzyl esterase